MACGWGYSMSLNSFFEIIKETPKGAVVKEIGSTVVENGAYLAGYETPNPEVTRTDKNWETGEFEPKIFKVIKTENGYKGKVGLSRTQYLTVTKVGDKHYFNHCD